jgi:hypothetical protein
MIVLGADTHKRPHTIAAVAAATGELLDEQTVTVGRRCLKRYLARRVRRLLQPPNPRTGQPHPSIS